MGLPCKSFFFPGNYLKYLLSIYILTLIIIRPCAADVSLREHSLPDLLDYFLHWTWLNRADSMQLSGPPSHEDCHLTLSQFPTFTEKFNTWILVLFFCCKYWHFGWLQHPPSRAHAGNFKDAIKVRGQHVDRVGWLPNCFSEADSSDLKMSYWTGSALTFSFVRQG